MAYNIETLAQALGVSRQTIHRHVSEGKLSGTKVGNERRFSAGDLVTYLGFEKANRLLRNSTAAVLAERSETGITFGDWDVVLAAIMLWEKTHQRALWGDDLAVPDWREQMVLWMDDMRNADDPERFDSDELWATVPQCIRAIVETARRA